MALGACWAQLGQFLLRISYLEVFLHIYLAINAGCQLGLQLEHLPVTLGNGNGNVTWTSS